MFAVLVLLAFILVLQTNILTIQLSVGAIVLASIYPFMKRYTNLPQVVLGAAFAWAIPMAFAAAGNTLPKGVWMLFTGAVIWTVAYDTFYAMIDREDDIKAGVKSTAVILGDMDRVMCAVLQAMFVIALLLAGFQLKLGGVFFVSVLLASALLAYQQLLIKDRKPEHIFRAFLNNNWVGLVIFLGIALDKGLKAEILQILP